MEQGKNKIGGCRDEESDPTYRDPEYSVPFRDITFTFDENVYHGRNDH